MVHACLNDAVSACREMRGFCSVDGISYAARQLAGEDGGELVGWMVMRCNGDHVDTIRFDLLWFSHATRLLAPTGAITQRSGQGRAGS